MTEIEKIKKEMVIREMKAEDRALICDLFDSMGGETRALFNRRDYNRRGVEKQLVKPDDERRYYIAVADGIAVGYVFFLSYKTGIPEIGIAIRDNLRGVGLGEILMRYAMDIAREDGKGGIYLTTHVANVRAQALYEKLGFRQMGVAKNGTELFYLLSFRDN